MRPTIKRSVIARVLTLFCLLMPTAHAVEIRSAEGETKSITVAADETVDDTLIATADTVTIDGTVTGNLIALGRAIEINGSVRGDLITGGQRVDLQGDIDGNVLAFGRGIDITGAVGHSVHAFAEDIRFTDSARAGGDLFAFGSELTIDGILARDAILFAGSSDVGGNVGRHLTARTGILTVTDSARVGGNLTAHTDKKANVRIADGATIHGTRATKLPEEKPGQDDGKFAAFLGSVIWKLFGIAAAFVTGLALFLLCPSLFAEPVDNAANVGQAMVIGFILLVTVPIAALVLMATLIGIPIGLLTLLTWLVALYVASIVVAVILGARMLRKSPAQFGPFSVALLSGLFVLAIAMSVPFLGFFVRLAVTVLGLGLLCTWIHHRWKLAGKEAHI